MERNGDDGLSGLRVEVAVDPDHAVHRRRDEQPSAVEATLRRLPLGLGVGELLPMLDGAPQRAGGQDARRVDQGVLASREGGDVGVAGDGQHRGRGGRDLALIERVSGARQVRERTGEAHVPSGVGRGFADPDTSDDVVDRKPSAAYERRRSTSATTAARCASSTGTARLASWR
jgi:hypothetical protein